MTLDPSLLRHLAVNPNQTCAWPRSTISPSFKYDNLGLRKWWRIDQSNWETDNRSLMEVAWQKERGKFLFKTVILFIYLFIYTHLIDFGFVCALRFCFCCLYSYYKDCWSRFYHFWVLIFLMISPLDFHTNNFALVKN
jgi:hypothetical protein